MTRAAPEPQVDAPLEDRVGYLDHIAANLQVASPDQLHGAAHLAPLTGLELPFLDLVAGLRDAVLEPGTGADLDELDRLLATSRARIEQERVRLEQEPARGADERPRASRVEEVRLLGEAMAAEVVLAAEASSLRDAVLERLERAVATADAAAEPVLAELAGIAAELRAGRDDIALARARALLATLGVEPLPGG